MRRQKAAWCPKVVYHLGTNMSDNILFLTHIEIFKLYKAGMSSWAVQRGSGYLT